MIADQTGALSIMGAGQANVATLVVHEMNAAGGLLGRDVELIIKDSATDDEQAAAAAAKLVQDDDVDVLLGGIFSSTREAIKQPAVVEGETLYIYPEQYEGQEWHPLLFCTGAVPAQQVEPLIPWVMQQTGARTFYLPSADYIWPHVMNRKVHEVASANGGKIVGEEYFPVDHADWGRLSTGSTRAARTSFSTRPCLPVSSRSLKRCTSLVSPRAAVVSSRRTSTRTSSPHSPSSTPWGCTRAWTTTSR